MFEETVLKHLKDLNENKAAGVDNLSGKYLKDGATVLANLISQICNLSIKYSIFRFDCNISGKYLKDGATDLANPISQICNLSINYSIFPFDCKIAKLKPLFKKDSKIAPKDYRPISLIPLVSKIIEKLIHDQTQSFLDKSDIIYRYQSGFRKFFFY